MNEIVEVAPHSLYAKLAEVMQEIGYVKKAGRNKFHGYDYVTEADLVDAVREKLAIRNVVVIPSVTAIDERAVTSDKGKHSTITTVRVAFTFCDGDSGEMHKAEWAGAGDDPADKGLYKAYTGAVKYFLMKSFLIPTGDDPEADEGTDKRSSGGQSSPSRYQRPPEVRDVKHVGGSDVTVDDPWVDSIKDRANKFRGELREVIGALGGTVPEHVSSWGRVLASLDPAQRRAFGQWLTTIEEQTARAPWVERKIEEAVDEAHGPEGKPPEHEVSGQIAIPAADPENLGDPGDLEGTWR